VGTPSLGICVSTADAGTPVDRNSIPLHNGVHRAAGRAAFSHATRWNRTRVGPHFHSDKVLPIVAIRSCRPILGHYMLYQWGALPTALTARF
jgi:hypothetical protein